jgi:hypothetical protein
MTLSMNDTQYNPSQHNPSQHNDTQHKWIITESSAVMLSVITMCVAFFVVMVSIIILSVVAMGCLNDRAIRRVFRVIFFNLIELKHSKIQNDRKMILRMFANTKTNFLHNFHTSSTGTCAEEIFYL